MVVAATIILLLSVCGETAQSIVDVQPGDSSSSETEAVLIDEITPETTEEATEVSTEEMISDENIEETSVEEIGLDGEIASEQIGEGV